LFRGRTPIHWVAAAVGLALLLTSTPARADNLGKLGEAALLLVLLSGINLFFNLGVLIAAVILGRRSAPVASYKRVLAVLGIIFASLCTAWNLMIAMAGLIIMDVISRRPSAFGEAAVALGVSIVPLVVSVCAIIWSAKLFGRNKPRDRWL
jgi:hypothetical protein